MSDSTEIYAGEITQPRHFCLYLVRHSLHYYPNTFETGSLRVKPTFFDLIAFLIGFAISIYLCLGCWFGLGLVYAWICSGKINIFLLHILKAETAVVFDRICNLHILVCRLLVWLGLVFAYGDAVGKEIYFPHVKACLQRVYACGACIAIPFTTYYCLIFEVFIYLGSSQHTTSHCKCSEFLAMM